MFNFDECWRDARKIKEPNVIQNRNISMTDPGIVESVDAYEDASSLPLPEQSGRPPRNNTYVRLKTVTRPKLGWSIRPHGALPVSRNAEAPPKTSLEREKLALVARRPLPDIDADRDARVRIDGKSFNGLYGLAEGQKDGGRTLFDVNDLFVGCYLRLHKDFISRSRQRELGEGEVPLPHRNGPSISLKKSFWYVK